MKLSQETINELLEYYGYLRQSWKSTFDWSERLFIGREMKNLEKFLKDIKVM